MKLWRVVHQVDDVAVEPVEQLPLRHLYFVVAVMRKNDYFNKHTVISCLWIAHPLLLFDSFTTVRVFHRVFLDFVDVVRMITMHPSEMLFYMVRSIELFVANVALERLVVPMNIFMTIIEVDSACVVWAVWTEIPVQYRISVIVSRPGTNNSQFVVAKWLSLNCLPPILGPILLK